MYKDIYEAPINLEISEKLVDKLEKLGAIVYITRTGDYDISNPNAWNKKHSDLQNRVNLIENSKADLYLSIHLNADSSNKWSGAQVFYDDVNEKNKLLAEKLQDSFKKNLNSKRKVKEISTYYMYRRIKSVPGVLVEVGFITNSNERYLLRQNTYQNKVCDSIIQGVLNYYK
ncbi:MAG: N-acetylmuramoyl-L-alanine amidase CwlD [Firmicutes bacterium]|nr:N-acetylmuramoyl-L-alanine amidase CwlD [Bacillota bacterium]